MGHHHEHVAALFDNEAHANAAADNLKTVGYDDVSVVSANTVGNADVVKKPHFWKRLFGDNVEEYEANVYGNTVGKGGAVVAVHAPTSNLAEAGGVLAAHNAVDIKQRAVDDGVLTPKGAASIKETVVARPVTPVTETLDRDEAIRLAQESIAVGKKVVETGTTRLRRYTVEKPVEKSITLHEEHAKVWEKAINEPADNVDWGDATIEVRETAEVPYESKSVRYIGEAGLREVGTDRTATVRDTIREQKVDVEEAKAEDIKLPAGWTEN